ncbi:hydantoinase/oxoprolinase family protein [Vulcanisaeta distributa]|uniref:5-oxoprolinase (ATP-hydrolyzing) n=1 Tax=Vulcanisaeta distributa (strain DSM 14429 / JCM 11212 / NBRC 100878 / IC-017) TaxID=572478 RepID=E1QUV3_VULDI|nr:hydantoinase/oxoprolinase family protein [Vulcanisaeta distributa]ADN49956.1 5-oxoprolinase (ATP-hydrolyzing) [Vulcanisaeta distributa DSM 14429]
MAIVAVDVGGTFTDFVVLRDDGTIYSIKVLSTPRSPEVAVLEGLRKIREPISEVLHATTIGTNTLLGQVGLEIPRVALFTTKGFRDIIEIGRQNRPRLYDLFFDKPRPLVPRELRFEVDERVMADGTVAKSVDPREVEEYAVRAKSMGVVSVAVSYLHSYINPSNEEITDGVLRRYFKYVSLSSRVAPEPREYERTSTTVVNAVLMPIVSEYIARFSEGLKELGIGRFYIMSSAGGLIDANEAVERPVQLIESGPAAGAVAAAEFSKLIGVENVIGFDMGGTTAKASSILKHEPEVTTEYEVGGEVHHGRLVKGSGYPVRFPFIDLAEVSSGGGTIIWRDDAGALRVGPISAGADPGPICYGRGGKEPTLTDANVALGRIGEYLLGGEMRLDRDAAVKGLSRLGDSINVALEAIRLAVVEMARAVRLVTVERGLDPRDFALMAFGGAGPQFAPYIAEELSINSVIVPPEPGAFSALGLLMADERFEARSSFPKDLEDGFKRLEDELLSRLGRVDYFLRYADVRYVGQGWELTIPIGRPASMDDVERVFNDRHYATYGFRLNKPIEVVTIRVFAVITRVKPRFRAPRAEGEAKPRSFRRVFFDDWVETPIYWREDIPMNQVIEGPAVIEEYGSTILIPPRWRATVGMYGEVRMTH